MPDIKTVQTEILNMKQKLQITILAHSYQAHEILEIADYVGDSFQLSCKAQSTDAPNILICGVHFMAETAKLLAPEKHIYLSHLGATCPMAIQFSPEDVLTEKAKYPGCQIVAYINTTAALKAVSDACVTSSTADRIVSRMDASEILFIPDCNLGNFVQNKVPEKKIHLMQGGCPVHAAVLPEEVLAAKQLYPDAKVLVHPECLPEVATLADFVGATSAIMDYARKSDATAFLIGTEMSIAEHLQYELPDKSFFPVSKKFLCPDMKLTTLMDIHHTLTAIASDAAPEIQLEPEIAVKARHCIDEMLRLGAN